MKLLLMYDAQVGDEIAGWLLEAYSGDIGVMVAMRENTLCVAARAKRIPCVIFESEPQLQLNLAKLAPFDLGLLAWWPKLISPAIVSLPERGFINTHPSLLPHNRGKHYNFWALVEQAPFGVTLHFVEKGIDCGDIIAQQRIDYDWTDTGESLYYKAHRAIVELLRSTYPRIREGFIERFPQELQDGSLHFANELEPASVIDIDKSYIARDLINLLRARTFQGHPACRFSENGETYEIRITISKVLP